MKKIDWDKVWKAFDKWWWKGAWTREQEEKKIQSLVEAQLKRKKHAK